MRFQTKTKDLHTYELRVPKPLSHVLKSFLSELKFLGRKVWEAEMTLLIGDTLFQQESVI